MIIPPFFCALYYWKKQIEFRYFLANISLLGKLFSVDQIFHYTRCIMPKLVRSLRGLSPRHYTRAKQLLSKKCFSNSKLLATLYPI